MDHMRARVLGALAAALAVGAFAIAPAIGSAEEVEAFAEQGCEANNVCGYSKINFEGVRYQVPCSQNGDWYPALSIKSARNRCGNKINYLGNYAICMNPSGDRPNPGTFAFLRLPAGYAPPYC